MKKFNKTYKQLLNELQGNWDDEYNKDPLEWRKKHGNKPYDWTNLDPKKWEHRKNLRSDNEKDPKSNESEQGEKAKEILGFGKDAEEVADYELGYSQLNYKRIPNSKNNLSVAIDETGGSFEVVYKMGDEKFDEVYFVINYTGKSSGPLFEVYDNIGKINEYNVTKNIYPAIIEVLVHHTYEVLENGDEDGVGELLFIKINRVIDYPKILKEVEKVVGSNDFRWEKYADAGTYIISIGPNEEEEYA